MDLVLTDVSVDELAQPAFPSRLEALFDAAPCDVAVLIGQGDTPVMPAESAPVLVPFGASEHDWAALELGAWLAASTGAVLHLMDSLQGATAGRDASRLLAHAALAVQGLVGVSTEPVLAAAGTSALVDAAAGTSIVLLGLSESWRQHGVGELRRDAAAALSVPVALVRRGLRPGGLTAPEDLTRYTWSLGAADASPTPPASQSESA